MTNLIVSLCIVAIVGVAIYKIIAMKRKGGGCAGCSQSSSCASNKSGC